MSTSVETAFRARVLLVCGSVLFTLLIAEFVLFPLLLPRTPLRLQVYLDDGIRPLAQSSKAGLRPEHWIALAGDSYAQGRGDWLLSVDPGGNGPFHSAHVIEQRTGRDVMSYGRGGSGPIRASLEAMAKQRYLAASWRFHVEPPESLIYYFYEGNDLHDALYELARLYLPERPGGDEAAGREDGEAEPVDLSPLLADPRFGDARTFQALLGEALARHPLVRRAESASPFEGFHLGHFVRAAIDSEWLGRERSAAPEEDVFPLRRQRPTALVADNFLRVRDTEIPTSVELQGPAPDLDAAETDAALWALEGSLRALRASFAGTRLCVVYVPSPAASYQLGGEGVRVQVFEGRPDVYRPERIEERSRELRDRVGALVAGLGLDYVDPTDAVRRNTRIELLHGPTDMRHFNRLGYTLLGNAASRCPGLAR